MDYIFILIAVVAAAIILFIIMDFIMRRRKAKTAQRGIYNAIYFIQIRQYEKALALLDQTEAEFGLLPEEMCDLCVQRADAYKGLGKQAEAADAYDALYEALLQCSGKRKRNASLLAELKACYTACGREADFEKWDRLFKRCELTFRKAEEEDLEAVAALYEASLDEEEAERTTTGWKRGIYPTAATAEEAIQKGTLYLAEAEGRLVGAAKIDREQPEAYQHIQWTMQPEVDKIAILHTLAIHPLEKGKGYGSDFVAFYEDLAREMGCSHLRLDTNERNAPARALYQKLGYTEAGITPCIFNGIEGVNLVCFEKEMIGEE